MKTSIQTETHLRAVVAEQRKEIERLQKLLAKLEVKRESEIAELKAKLAEEKKNKWKIVVGDPTAAAREKPSSLGLKR